MSAPRRLLAELMIEQRAPERGLRLIEWAVECKVSGVVIPRRPWVSNHLAQQLCQSARACGLDPYLEISSSDDLHQPLLRDAAGYLLRPRDLQGFQSLLALRTCQKPMLLLVDNDAAVDLDLGPVDERLVHLIVIVMNRGERLAEWFRLRQQVRELGWGVGYSDEFPEPWRALNGALAGAETIVKGLTLNRSLGGPEHQGSLYPHEFARLVSYVREHESLVSTFQQGAAQLAAVPQGGSPLAFTPSLVARRSLRAGSRVASSDVETVPKLKGFTPAMTARLEGAQLLYDREPGEPMTFGMVAPWTVRSSGLPLEISVVIRTKNEAGWLRRSLWALLNQQRPPREIIVVDNDSSDESAAVARQFECRVLTMRDDEFSFGRALNRGIDAARCPWVVNLSAHCIPVHDRWLESFACERATGYGRLPFVAAAYGRQEPMPDTSHFDKRDLWTTFGAERRMQHGQDYFFHNANSMICKAVWQRIPFDEQLNGVEDRDWAKKVLAEGHQIVYTPLASVYHYHGIHQGRDERRAQRVARVIELIHERPHVPTAASVSSLEG